jgi:soluble lytic murein transglycosylase
MDSRHFHILLVVAPNLILTAIHRLRRFCRMNQFTVQKCRQTGLVFALLVLVSTVQAAQGGQIENSVETQRQDFNRAWQAAKQGNRKEFERLMPGLEGYLLYPYLEYENYRHRRASVDAGKMALFLENHRSWAFTAGLKTAWLKALGKRGRWDSLILYASGSPDTEVQCYLAQARIQRQQVEGLEAVAKALWAVGESQPDACDPVFVWLKKQGGITPGLAWERIGRAMQARQPRLTLYLARYLGPDEQVWADRWYQQDRGGYRQLDRTRSWPDQEKSREITAYGLRRLARADADKAWRTYVAIENGFNWPEAVRGGILREIALWSAVEGADGTPQRMQAVPAEFRDGKLLEWWARFSLTRADWEGVMLAIELMPTEQQADSGWRYWNARAQIESGNPEQATLQLEQLALEANYHGFLSADRLGFPYNICPEEPSVTPAEVEALRDRPGFSRALELSIAGIRNWSRSEWQLAEKRLDNAGLRIAAALAVEENWPDMAIFALGNSGDLKWYSWRFPTDYAALVEVQALGQNLDPAWVLGLMRSESAMAEDAISSAGARGLMQVMPKTASQLAKRHSINYSGKQQLLQASENIVLGTLYLRELLDKFSENPVLASGAYNAGPGAVARWLNNRRTDDPEIWVETLPYYETRDYIPRVLAFSTLYDWRLAKPVSRISSRMPEFYSGAGGGNMEVSETAEVVCRTPG